MNTRILAILFLAFVAACAPQGAVAPGEDAEEKIMATTPITIGFIGPLSGDNAGIGGDGRAGVALAVQDINAEGGVNGRQLEVIYEDGKCIGKDANTAASKLINVDNVQFIVGGLCSAETLATAPLAEEAKVLLISYASSNPSITQSGDYVFRTWPSDAGQGKAMAEEIITRGHKKVAVAYQNSDYNLGLANAFKENFEHLGGEITAWETYEPDAKDFRTQVAKVRASKPDAIYIVPYSVDGGLLIKQIRELKIELPLFGSETLGSKEAVEAAGEDNVEGLVYATPRFDAESSKAREFLPRAQNAKGGDLSIPAIAANAYDAVQLISEALRANPEAEPSAMLVKDYLYTVKGWDGVGGKLTFDENGDPLKEFQVMYVHAGQFYPAP